ncbi:MAG: hypothetical protein U9Q70_04190 [Chloroflexota bacterium]|nr:hypothetical protein [Chloroflexota bacterium]
MSRSPGSWLLLSAGWALLALGCELLAIAPSSAPATYNPAPEIATATALPTSTPNPCPAKAEVPLPSRPDEFPDGYLAALRAYLAAGGDPAELAELLESWEALPPMGKGALTTDLTGGGGWELTVSLIDPLAETFPPPGMMAIYTCQTGEIELLDVYPAEEYAYFYLVGSADLTANGLDELVFVEVYCGAHTCWHTAHVWAWDGVAFKEQLPADLFSLPYADFWLEKGQIVGESGGIGSVGAGPQRPYREIWAWNGSVITQTAEVWGTSEWRYHALRDGDTALLAEDYDVATEAYLRVLNDTELQEYGLWYGEADEQLWLEALAQWRLLTVALQLGDIPDAEVRYDILSRLSFPADQPGHPVALLAQRFWEGYLETGNLPSSCLAAVEEPAAEEVLEFLNSFGYANSLYTVEELCPFLTQ